MSGDENADEQNVTATEAAAPTLAGVRRVRGPKSGPLIKVLGSFIRPGTKLPNIV
jgi:hypothetical protein